MSRTEEEGVIWNHFVVLTEDSMQSKDEAIDPSNHDVTARNHIRHRP